MRRTFSDSSMELCYECEDNQGWDSSDSSVERTSRADSSEDGGDEYRPSCSKCGTWIGKPQFMLEVFHGRLAEPLDPHSFEMKPCLWSNLPQECLEMILARLPLGSRVRFSTVSKTWQSLLASSDFKRLYDSVEPPPARPICRMQDELAELASFKPRGELEVVEVGLSFLPPKFQAFEDYVVQDGLVCIFKVVKEKAEKPEVETQRPQMFVSRSDGAGVGDGDGYGDGYEDEDDEEEDDEEEEEMEEEEVEVEEEDSTAENEDESYRDYDEEDDDCKKAIGMSFCVANPIMRTFKELPPEFGIEADFHDYPESWRVQLEVAENGHFTVIVLCRRKNIPTVSIYRSKENSWKATALTQPRWFSVRERQNDWPQYFLCNGELCEAKWDKLMTIHCLESGQVIWDGSWGDKGIGEDEATEPRRTRKFFAWQGRIFCLDQDYEKHEVDFGVWKLERSPYMWRKVSFMPEHLQEMLLGAVRNRGWSRVMKHRIYLDGATLLGDTLYFTIANSSLHDHTDGLSTHLVGYNIPDNAWSLISKDSRTFFWNISYHLFRPNGVGV